MVALAKPVYAGLCSRGYLACWPASAWWRFSPGLLRRPWPTGGQRPSRMNRASPARAARASSPWPEESAAELARLRPPNWPTSLYRDPRFCFRGWRPSWLPRKVCTLSRPTRPLDLSIVELNPCPINGEIRCVHCSPHSRCCSLSVQRRRRLSRAVTTFRAVTKPAFAATSDPVAMAPASERGRALRNGRRPG